MTTRILSLIVLAFLLAGCSNEPEMTIAWRMVIPADRQAAAAEWVIKASMPHGPVDADPEDLLEQATRSALDLFGGSTIGVYVNYQFTPYADTTGPARVLLDDYLATAKGGRP